MNLHENKQLFRQSVQFTAQGLQIPEIYVEKDYWVTYVLKEIFKSPIGKETVFKGGTSLLKCYQFIQRFSEDIDLVVFRREGEPNNRLTTKIREIGRIASGALPEIHIEEVTQKMGMNRKTAHSYNKEFAGNYGQVRDVIIVEATWLGYFEPFTVRPVSPFIYDMMVKAGQMALAEEYGLLPFDAQVLEPKRTVCEKIMSLVRFSYGNSPVEDLKKKIRHAYDLHQLLNNPGLSSFFGSPEFDSLLLKVGQDDVLSFPNNNAWLQYHPTNALIFSDTEKVWQSLEMAYNGDFRALVFGSAFPNGAAIFATLVRIRERLSKIEWHINL